MVVQQVVEEVNGGVLSSVVGVVDIVVDGWVFHSFVLAFVWGRHLRHSPLHLELSE